MRDLSMHVLDIAENATHAGAKNVLIRIRNSMEDQSLSLKIMDDGHGMDKETLARAVDPYFTSRTTRRIGMGLPLLKQNAERTGGAFAISSTPGQGTTVEAIFRKDHLDCPPEGDIADAIVFLFLSHPSIRLTFQYAMDKGTYDIGSHEIREVLGDSAISISVLRDFIKAMIHENMKELNSKT